jgi:hypothetical protein
MYTPVLCAHQRTIEEPYVGHKNIRDIYSFFLICVKGVVFGVDIIRAWIDGTRPERGRLQRGSKS